MHSRIRFSALLPLVAVIAGLMFPALARGWQSGEAFPSIAAAIQGLGADEFATRQAASEFLWKAGAAALEPLKAAAQSDDAEVKFRATIILRKVRLGITPETPYELQELIGRYYEGDQNARQQVIQNLRLKGSFDTLYLLLQGETDATRRDQFLTILQGDVQRFAPQMLASGDWSPLEQWLEKSKVADNGLVQQSAWSLLQGTLPAAVERAEADLAAAKDNALLVRRLAHVLRAQGETEKVLQLLNSGPIDPHYAAAIHREQRRWDDLEATLGKVTSKNTREMLFYRATRSALHRLRGEDEQARELLKTMTDQAKTEDCWYGAKALLLNEQPIPAVELLREGLQPMAFDLLVQRNEFEQALRLADIDDDTKFDQVWLNELTGQKGVRTSRSVDRFTYAVSIAIVLKVLGKQRQFDELYQLLVETAELDDQRGQYWQHLGRLQRQLNNPRASLDFYSRSVSRSSTSTWSQLFGKKTARAQLWWDALDGPPLWQDVYHRLEVVALALQPDVYRQHVDVDWPAVVKHITARAAEPATFPSQRAKLHAALAEAWDAQGKPEAAAEHWKLALSADPAVAMDYADALLAQQNWSAAAEQYQAASAANSGLTLARYLQGEALSRGGDAAAGKKLQDVANLMALDYSSRYTLALALQDRNLRATAHEQWKLLVQTGMPDHSYVMTAHQHLGNDLAEKLPLQAADHWEQLRFHLLKPAVSLAEQNGYLELTVAIHRTRARGLLAQGKRDETLNEVKLCEALLPGNIKLVEDFVPQLRKADLQAEADGLFERTYAVYERELKHFPDSTHLHNQAAWTAAISQRRLDDALRLAKRAVELDPKSAAYADTLAEAYFARGDREAALKWARKATTLSPDSKSYEARLKSFGTRELPPK
jgi:tetratricopeptide (TPR) repeat protein